MENTAVDIQFVRLDDDVREMVNKLARQSTRRVSDIVNEVLREWMRQASE
jgi:predicted transcriptional regulator